MTEYVILVQRHGFWNLAIYYSKFDILLSHAMKSTTQRRKASALAKDTKFEGDPQQLRPQWVQESD